MSHDGNSTGVNPSVICIGELLWDVFPDGRRTLGGAPANVTYHLERLGVSALLISRIGSDELGRAASAELARSGLCAAGLQVDSVLPTGKATITLGAHGATSYEFATPAAWDAIEPVSIVATQAVVFGTLAQRDPRSRTVLRALARSAAERIYDINLRPPHTPVGVVAESLALATAVKMNEEEAGILARELQLPNEPRAFALEIMRRYGPRVVCVTRGELGAYLAAGDLWAEVDGAKIKVCDSVGAGDAFLAALIAGLLSGTPWLEALRRANSHGAWVASQRGAMPPFERSPSQEP